MVTPLTRLFDSAPGHWQKCCQTRKPRPLDWLTFISTDIKSLAWPTAAIIALFVLKRQITALLGALGDRLLTAKGGGFEFTFGERVDQVEEVLPAPEAKEITAPPDAQRIQGISDSTQLPPPYIVSQAWLRLDQAIREAVDIPPARPGNRRPPRAPDYLDLATVQGLLTPDETPAVRRLREMRNLAAHSLDPPISMTDGTALSGYCRRADSENQRTQCRQKTPLIFHKRVLCDFAL